MKNLIFILLNVMNSKAASGQNPDNYQETVVEITGLGKFVLGIVIGIIATLCIIGVIKAFKKKPEEDNDDHNNDAKN